MAVAAESGQIVAQLVDPPFPEGDPDRRVEGEFLGHRSAFRNLGMRENMIQSLALEGFPARPMSSLAARLKGGGWLAPLIGRGKSDIMGRRRSPDGLFDR